MDLSSIGSTAARFLHVRFRQAPNPGPGSSPRTGKNFLTSLAELPVGSGIGRGSSSFREDRWSVLICRVQRPPACHRIPLIFARAGRVWVHSRVHVMADQIRRQPIPGRSAGLQTE